MVLKARCSETLWQCWPNRIAHAKHISRRAGGQFSESLLQCLNRSYLQCRGSAAEHEVPLDYTVREYCKACFTNFHHGHFQGAGTLRAASSGRTSAREREAQGASSVLPRGMLLRLCNFIHFWIMLVCPDSASRLWQASVVCRAPNYCALCTSTSSPQASSPLIVTDSHKSPPQNVGTF